MDLHCSAFTACWSAGHGASVIDNLGFSGPAIVLHGVLIGVGDTRSVLIANVIGNGVNVALNVLLIHGVGPCPSSGVLGSGISTAIVPA